MDENQKFLHDIERAVRRAHDPVFMAHLALGARAFIPNLGTLNGEADGLPIADLLVALGRPPALMPWLPGPDITGEARATALMRLVPYFRVGPARKTEAHKALFDLVGAIQDRKDGVAYLREMASITADDDADRRQIWNKVIAALLPAAVGEAVLDLCDLQRVREGAGLGSQYIRSADGDIWIRPADNFRPWLDGAEIQRYLHKQTRNRLEEDLISQAEAAGLSSERDPKTIKLPDPPSLSEIASDMSTVSEDTDDFEYRQSAALAEVSVESDVAANLVTVGDAVGSGDNEGAAPDDKQSAEAILDSVRLKGVGRRMFDLLRRGYERDDICDALGMAPATFQRNWNRLQAEAIKQRKKPRT